MMSWTLGSLIKKNSLAKRRVSHLLHSNQTVCSPSVWSM
jgi:hypothetical protein